MDGIAIRGATPDDVAALAEYHHRCFNRTYADRLLAGDVRQNDRDAMRRQFHEWFQPGSGFETHVAVADGQPIAHVTVHGHHLVHLFVEPDHQRSGLGRRLLALGEATIADAGHTDLELHARVDNLAAVAFYQRTGWTVTDHVIHTVEHGIGYDEHVLVKHLPQPEG